MRQEPHRVLVVNDDPELLRSRCAVLSSEGISAIEALGVEEAARFAAREQYEAVLIDATNVTFEHGTRLCTAIKAARPSQKVILLIAAHHVAEDVCADVVFVRDHPDLVWPKILAAVRGGDVGVGDELAPEDI